MLGYQVMNLRPAIASLVETLTPPPISTVSTSQMYLDFAKAANQALQDIRKLKESWGEQGSQDALRLGRESLKQNDDLEWEFVRKTRQFSVESLDDMTQSLTNTAA
jgi:hypothetical protein